MRVIALGGAGAMGRLAVKTLAASEAVSELTIADYNLEGAGVLAGELGEKCTATKLDADNHGEMVDAVRGHDAALGTIGPFYKYEAKMARACIEAGVNYVSICDDYDAAAGLLELDADAREAGITAITGVGWTPGITNVLARKASGLLDEVEDIAVSWGCHTMDTEGKAVTAHVLHIFSGMIPSYQGGRTAWVPAGSGGERVRFPDPVGDVFVRNLGHPEPVTIPRYINAGTVTLKGGMVEEYVNQLCIWLNRLWLIHTQRQQDIWTWCGNNIIVPALDFIPGPGETGSACRVDVTGKVKGKWTHMVYGAEAHMDLLTGLPAAVCVQMLLEGKVDATGAMGPEACLQPEEFLGRLKEGGIRFFQGPDMTDPLELG